MTSGRNRTRVTLVKAAKRRELSPCIILYCFNNDKKFKGWTHQQIFYCTWVCGQRFLCLKRHANEAAVLPPTPFGFVLSFLPVPRWVWTVCFGLIYCCCFWSWFVLVAYWWRTYSYRISLLTGAPLLGSPFAVALERCMFVLLSDVFACSFLVCLFLCFLFVGAGFDPSVSLTCWCTPVFLANRCCVAD